LNIIADLHTHTIASTHAYSTVSEMVRAASENGLLAIAITDHGPATPDSPHMYHFSNLKVIPRKMDNVTILRGVEANITNFNGDLDMMENERVFKMLDWVIASMHEPVMTHGHTTEEYTKAWLGVIANPYVDMLGHMGDGRFPFDYDVVLKEAAKQNKIVEINNASFNVRPGTNKNCFEIAKKCIQHGVKIAVTSDAHFSSFVGKFSISMQILEELGIPKEMIINSSIYNLAGYLNSRPNKEKIIF